MRPIPRVSRVELFDIEPLGGGAGTSSDRVCFHDPKRVRVRDSGRDPIHVDDVEGLGLGGAVRPSTMYESRTRRPINPVITNELRDLDYCDNAAAHRAVHRDYPNPHNYTVRTIHKDDLISHGCRCVHGCEWDPVTKEAEFLCGCGSRRNDPGEYAGEWEDNHKFYMKGGDLCVPGSQPVKKKTQSIFGGNPYKC